ncbi:hypothetical protein GCM10027277_57600 [Pseudoduganella ginsengisoli]|uniref:Uncharacterized protein n=1 Tax=Pseudoduganella ginsengisoli TaxID=1462440 RepID=A0A6L6Q8X2_9BURK|nr:hypothetical protein [Pseudoduganella ginsengisoli]MTW05876.1 hypothetical protein [Pseudoduganella ginsengisoli]
MNPKYALNLSLFVKDDGPTITKHQLNRLIDHLPDDADIYLFTKLDCVTRAMQISAEVGTTVLSFSLTGDVIEEPHGVSLMARAAG